MQRATDPWRDGVSRQVARARGKRRERNRVRLKDVDRFRREGLVAESLKPLALLAQDEAGAIFADLGGDEAEGRRRGGSAGRRRLGRLIRWSGRRPAT